MSANSVLSSFPFQNRTANTDGRLWGLSDEQSLHVFDRGRATDSVEFQEMMNFYQSRLRRVQMERDMARTLNIRYRMELEYAQKQVEEASDKLLAIQIAYDELVASKEEDFGDVQTYTPNPFTIPTVEPEPFDSDQDPSLYRYDVSDLDEEFEIIQQLELIDHSDEVESNHTTPLHESTTFYQTSAHVPTSQPESNSVATPAVPAAHHSDHPSPLSGLSAQPESDEVSQGSPPRDPMVLPPPRSPQQDISPEIFVDASSKGIGFIYRDTWLAWTFVSGASIPSGKGKVVMSWAETVAVELGIRALVAAGFKSTRVIVRSDNSGVVAALSTRRWTNDNGHGLQTALQRVFSLCRENDISIVPRWIWTKRNPADGPSRGVYPRTSRFSHQPALPAHLSPILHAA